MLSNRVPSYRKHRASGQGIVTLPDGLGGRKDVLLGKWRSKESRVEYARVIGEWEAAGRRLPRSLADAASDITIAELVLSYWPEVEKHYRRLDGTPTHEVEAYRHALKPLRVLYGHTIATKFGPLALEVVRQSMITGSYLTEKEKEKRAKMGRPVTLCRGVVNQRVGRIRHMFRWAVSKELLPPEVLKGLESLKGLERGRSDARETEPVKPINVAHVEATLPYLTPTVADLVALQLATGARSGEMCELRACDIDMSGKVWLYTPAHHKTLHRGKARAIAIGPRGQEIVRRHLKPDLQAFLFSPADSVEEKRERGRRERKTKIFPCELKRMAAKKRRKPKCQAGEKYTAATYAIAIRRAVKRANKDREAQDLPPIPHWHPHQLRHTKATEIRREFGLDAARVALGHTSPLITELYAELDTGKAIEVAAKLG